MPLRSYSVLKGRPVGIRLGSGASPHYQIHIVVGDEDYRIAINVQSGDGSECDFLLRSRFEHPITARLAELAPGLHPQAPGPDGLGLDYIRGNLLQPQKMVPLPATAAGPDNDLNEKLDHYIQRALADENAVVYAFGATWGPEPGKPDKYFGFRPGRGIHDIHMNQGNPPPPKGKAAWFEDNGPWQDGGLVIQFPSQEQWVAVFMKFQSQAWHTDDDTGKPLDLGDGTPTSHHLPPHHVPTRTQPDGLVRIVAALVNDTATPERETVTLLNTADRDLALDGWSLVDKMKNRMPLEGEIGKGATRLIVVAKPVELSNRGGIISLLDERGVKVHGVSYTRDQARTPGLTIAFGS
ncbi:YukJ family protein [Methylobacterium tardum]|uniref:DUF2278 family protein n=1 Tax=Methylobacterium tardum TaxID=374432 RepID=UPI002020F419|nr:YukJ family protein [Methylobacterium tardum]URD35158.1 YukJ family protein [Methylobacterium tardum]